MSGQANDEGSTFLVCRDVPHLILMLASASVLYTLVINASSMKTVMSLLKLTELTEERHLMLASACSELANETDEFVDQLKIAFTLTLTLTLILTLTFTLTFTGSSSS